MKRGTYSLYVTLFYNAEPEQKDQQDGMKHFFRGTKPGEFGSLLQQHLNGTGAPDVVSTSAILLCAHAAAPAGYFTNIHLCAGSTDQVKVPQHIG